MSDSVVKIVPNSDVLFDWDNTLKKIVRNPYGGPPTLYSSVSAEILDQMISQLNCRVFILTAISNSSLGCQTLKMEVERLGLRNHFLFPEHKDQCYKQETSDGAFWRWGNGITCGGTSKADVYLQCCRQEGDEKRPVYFFDDEINNIRDFEIALPDSTVYHVVNEVPISLSPSN